MDPELNRFLWLVLGWLFGLLSPGIAERIRRKHRQADVVAALTDELIELQYMMSLVAYRVRGHLGEVTDEFLDWLRPIIQNYHGPEADPKLGTVLERSRKELTQEHVGKST